MSNNSVFLDFYASGRIKRKLKNELQVMRELVEVPSSTLKRKSDPLPSSPSKQPKLSPPVSEFELNYQESENFDYIEIKEEVFEDESYSNPPESPTIIDIKPTGDDESSDKIQCTLCNREFSKKTYLIQHMRAVHEHDKNQKCKTCGKKFKTEKILQQHMTKHLTEKPFKCVHCPKTFCHKFDMKRHELSHYIKNRYMCDQCTHGFARKDHLEKHRKTHARRN